MFGLLHKSDRNYDEAVKCYRNALKIDKVCIKLAFFQFARSSYSPSPCPGQLPNYERSLVLADSDA